jgi:transketolase
MRNAFADAVYELSKTDERIFALVADISPAGSMLKFRDKFPERFINTGVAEQAMIGIAAGLAMRGLRPFCYTIATFALYRPFEMVRVDLAYQKLPVTVVGMGAGVIYSTLGSTHQSIEDIAVSSAIPNMTVLAPCDPEEMRECTYWCAKQNEGPVYMRLGKAGEPDLTSNAVDPFSIGRVRYIKSGSDVAILSYGTILKLGLELADRLETLGINASVVSVHTLKPLDRSGIEAILSSYSLVVVIEEHVPHGGLGSRVKETAFEKKYRGEILHFSLGDDFKHFYGSYDELLRLSGLEVCTVEREVVSRITGKQNAQ